MDRDLLHDVFQWEVRTWSRALPMWEKALAGREPGRALAIGERDGGLSLWLALRGYHVLCTDLSPSHESARALHQRRGVADRVTYAVEDAMALGRPDADVDVVVFKSVIGALGTREKQEKALLEMHRVLKPGGVLLFAENTRSTWVHTWLRKRFNRWTHYWRYLEWPADQGLFAPFAQKHFATTGLLANLGRSEAQRRWLAGLDAALCPIVPSGWHTVMMGACMKAG